MTEKQFQQARKVMKTANHVRGLITIAKGNIAKWTAIEAANRENMQPDKADGAKKMLLLAMKRLEELRQRFADLKFPDDKYCQRVERTKDVSEVQAET